MFQQAHVVVEHFPSDLSAILLQLLLLDNIFTSPHLKAKLSNTLLCVSEVINDP